MEKTKKQKLKHRRTLMHLINTCLKHNMGFKVYEGGSFTVTDFDPKCNEFKFREDWYDKFGQSIYELQDKLHVYIKHHKQK